MARHASLQSRHPARHARHARHARRRRRAAARLRARASPQAHLRRTPRGPARLALPLPAPPRESRHAQGRMEGHGERTRGKVLSPHGKGAQAARDRSVRVEGIGGSDCPGSGHRVSWLGRLFRRERLERELDKELQFHLDAAAADLIRDGMSPDEARRVARVQLGGLEYVKEETRDARGTGWVIDWWRDTRYALRGMARSPAFSAAAILTIAIGVGANTAVWSILDALMRRSLPVERPEELHALKHVGVDDDHYRTSHPLMLQLQAVLP